MGYSNYIGSISKKKFNKLKKIKSIEQLELEFPDMFEWCEFDSKNILKTVYHWVDVQDIFEFGKYCDSEMSKFNKPLFHKKIRKELTCDDEFEVMTKEGIRNIISYYTSIMINFNEELKNLLNNKDIDAVISKLMPTLVRKIFDFKGHVSNVVDCDCENITDSCSYEYAIFELTRIYKTFDWKRNVMIWYGW